MIKTRRVVTLINIPLYLAKLKEEREIHGFIRSEPHTLLSHREVVKYKLQFKRMYYDKALFNLAAPRLSISLDKEIKLTKWWALTSEGELYPFHLLRFLEQPVPFRSLNEIILQKEFPLSLPFKGFYLKGICLFCPADLITSFKYSHRPLKE